MPGKEERKSGKQKHKLNLLPVYIFCWVPLTSQTQLEHGKQRHSADVLQRHQVLEDGSLGTNETNPGND